MSGICSSAHTWSCRSPHESTQSQPQAALLLRPKDKITSESSSNVMGRQSISRRDHEDEGVNDDANSSEAEVDNRHQADRQADLKFLTRRRISALFVTTVIILAIIVLAFLSTASKDPRQACVSPAVRREWRQLNNTEKKTYIDAVKCLQTFPSQLTGIGRRSDDFPWLHRHIAKSIHDTSMFLPYHRYLIHLYEKSLRELCHYSGVLTYWDWALDWEDPIKSAIWDPETGFGGDGDPDGPLTVGWGSCIANGSFADYKVLFYNFIPRLHCLSRGLGRCFERPWTGDAFKPSAIQHVLDQGTFADFSSAIESGPHDAVPNNVCGDFYYLEAPNDPVFFLHHTNLDRLWLKWQEKKAGRTWEYNGRANSVNLEPAKLDDVLTMKGLGPDMTIRQVMDTKSGIFCYTY